MLRTIGEDACSLTSLIAILAGIFLVIQAGYEGSLNPKP